MTILEKLIRPKSQRLQMALGWLLSIALLIPLYLQVKLEQSRTQFPQLDSTNLSYCELPKCLIAELSNLEVASVEIEEQDWATFVYVRFVNHGRLEGEREIWLELTNPEQEIAEAAKTRLVLSNRGPVIAVFSFQRKPLVLEQGTLRLSY
jgi:hypothetical protein